MKYFKLLALLMYCLVATPAAAQNNTYTLEEGTGVLVNLPRAASSIFVGDPGVADVRVVSGDALFLAGIATGSTNVFALDFDDTLIAKYEVSVVGDNRAADRALKTAIPNDQVKIESNDNAVILRGEANSLDEAFAILDSRRVLNNNARTVIDRTELKQNTQVSLKVRFVEASRNELAQVGLDLSAIGSANAGPFRVVSGTGLEQAFNNASITGNGGLLAGVDGGNVDALLRALEQSSIIEILSEPTLTTTSGRRASFRSGGEFAIPVPQGDGVVGVEYRQYGVSLDFLPTVLPNDRIAIEVSPEVSFVNPDAAGTDIDGFVAPTLSVRRADTTVEVASGQTFAIAGLYEQRQSQSSQGVPGLNRSKLFGPIFGSRSRTQEERELLILITPYLASATDVSAPARKTTETNVTNLIGFITK